MRGLMKAKRWIYYSNYQSVSYKTNEKGLKTGSKSITYTDIRKMFGTVSTPTGGAVVEMFGSDEKYDKVIVLDKPDIVIKETSVLWLDVPYGEDVPHDYEIKRIVRNRNFLIIGTRKVDVKNGTDSSNET